jgi:hypothetical protein
VKTWSRANYDRNHEIDVRARNRVGTKKSDISEKVDNFESEQKVVGIKKIENFEKTTESESDHENALMIENDLLGPPDRMEPGIAESDSKDAGDRN